MADGLHALWCGPAQPLPPPAPPASAEPAYLTAYAAYLERHRAACDGYLAAHAQRSESAADAATLLAFFFLSWLPEDNPPEPFDPDAPPVDVAPTGVLLAPQPHDD